MISKLTIAAGFALALLAGTASAETIKVGVTPGPHAQILEKVKEVAARDGLELEILEFSDYVVPNQALNDGDLDANSFQHEPYLDNQIRDRGYKIETVAYTVNFPMGVYSKKYKSFDEVPDGATIAIPNDPTNGGRALLVLQANGLIKLKPEIGLKATPADVVENPKNIQFAELDAAQLPRSLDDTDASVINTNYEWDTLAPGEQWRHSHNYVHHTYTNVLGLDHDIGYRVARLSEEQPWHPKWLLGNVVNTFVLATLFEWGVGVHDSNIADAYFDSDPSKLKTELVPPLLKKI